MEADSQGDYVCVSMKRGAEKVSSPENRSREIVTILMSFGLVLGLVLVNFKVAKLYEDKFGDAAVDRSDLCPSLSHRG